MVMWRPPFSTHISSLLFTSSCCKIVLQRKRLLEFRYTRQSPQVVVIVQQSKSSQIFFFSFLFLLLGFLFFSLVRLSRFVAPARDMFERRMLEMKEPAFKLFGMKIPLPAADSVSLSFKDVEDDIPCSEEDATFMKIVSVVKKANSDRDEETDTEEDASEGKGSKSKQEISGGSTNLETTPETDESSKSSSVDEETSKTGASSADKAQSGTTDANSDEKQTVLKKPDKLLPCPRCKSMETKFCYYNNYNVHQPRHFCKSCQRYWTAGGTMRNVPVGAGRRKNKNSASRYGRCIISDAIQAAGMDCYPNAAHNHQALNRNGTVLSFSVDPSKSESVTSVLDQGKKQNYASSSSIESDSNPTEESGRNHAQMPPMSNSNGLSPQIPWPYAWNPAIHPGCFTYPGYGYVIPNYFSGTIPNAWSIPWLQNAASLDSVSSTLGKHPREEKGQATDSSEEQNRPKKGIWAPKTLRIDDPEEAAKSSIWETLGIKCDAISRGGLFKGFQPKDDKKNQLDASSAMAANPAALSRSLNFRECY